MRKVESVLDEDSVIFHYFCFPFVSFHVLSAVSREPLAASIPHRLPGATTTASSRGHI